MCLKVLLLTVAVVFQIRSTFCQRQWIPPTTTAAEMWNPYTWYWPYATAAAEGYQTYFQNAQQITNQLYMQAYATNAFWWTNAPAWGPGGGPGGAPSQPGQATGGATGQPGQGGGQTPQPVQPGGQPGGQPGQVG